MVSVPAGSSFELTDAITLEALVKRSTPGREEIIAGKCKNQPNGFHYTPDEDWDFLDDEED